MIESFVLFTEQKEILNKLSDEQAGKIFKAIFEYATNGEIPKDIKDDLVLDIVFTTLKQTIDRNQEKWQEIKQKRSEAGKKHKGNQYTNNGTDKNEMEQMEQMEQNGTNGTNNVSVSVNDNVSVSVSGSGSVINNNVIPATARDEVWTFYLNNINSTPVEYEIDTIKSYEDELPQDLIIYAMQKAVLGRARKISYISKILDTWKSKGITTLSEAQKEQKVQRQKTTNKFFDDSGQYDNLDRFYDN